MSAILQNIFMCAVKDQFDHPVITVRQHKETLPMESLKFGSDNFRVTLQLIIDNSGRWGIEVKSSDGSIARELL